MTSRASIGPAAAAGCIAIAGMAFAPSASVSSRIDSLVSGVVRRDSPGIAVFVLSSGRRVFEHGYGVRDLRTRRGIDAATNFRLASVTKQFTATAVMLLVRDGKLRYDTPVTDVFPDFAAYGRRITVRHLLTHTSGLPDYEDLMASSGASAWNPSHQIRDGEVVDLLKRQTGGKFEPGTQWAYSNSGYVLLGAIVAKVARVPFERFLRARVFTPLKMNNTLAWVKGTAEIPNRAYGHSVTEGRFEETDQSATSATLGDGGVYSNLADLAKWDEALRRHVLLRTEEMRAALRPVELASGAEPRWPSEPGEDNLAPGAPVKYGFGWFLDPWHGHRRMWHFGSTVGFRTAIERFPSESVTVVVLCNRTDIDPGVIALRIAEIVFDSFAHR